MQTFFSDAARQAMDDILGVYVPAAYYLVQDHFFSGNNESNLNILFRNDLEVQGGSFYLLEPDYGQIAAHVSSEKLQLYREKKKELLEILNQSEEIPLFASVKVSELLNSKKEEIAPLACLTGGLVVHVIHEGLVDDFNLLLTIKAVELKDYSGG